MFFFFQAEDGILDTSVTGVQTCALPILDTKEVSEIFEVMNRHLAEHGIHVPFPSNEAPLLGDNNG